MIDKIISDPVIKCRLCWVSSISEISAMVKAYEIKSYKIKAREISRPEKFNKVQQK